jgi:hypothetical protein
VLAVLLYLVVKKLNLYMSPKLKTNSMKKSFSLLSVILSGILVTTFFSCTETPKETCEQDEICTEKFVTACCTDSVCVYKYNGHEYTEDQIGQLADDLGCTTKKALKSAGQEDDLSAVVTQLKALMIRVQERTKSGN